LQIFAAKSGFHKSTAVASLEDVETDKDGVRYKHVQEHHFDSTVKRMTVIYHDLEHRTNIAFMKGAPERVLDACTYDSQGTPLTPETKDEVLRLMDRFASEGLVSTSPRKYH
jgi:magnesium-transporting ATPase (P-type)